MQLGNLRVTRHPDVVVIVQDISADEQACFVSKAGSDTIEGRYLYELAGAVADVQPKVDALIKAVENYKSAVDNRVAHKAPECYRNMEKALADLRADQAAKS